MSIDISLHFPHRAIALIKTAASPDDSLAGVSVPDMEAPVLKNLGNGLFVAYVVESGDNLFYVQNRHLQDTPFDADVLHRIGIDNLAERSDDKATLKQYGAIYGVFLDNLFEASLILRDDLWDDTLAYLAPNGFVAALPARDTLAVCDAGSAEGVASLQAMVKRAFAEGKQHLLSPNLYRRQAGRWVIYN